MMLSRSLNSLEIQGIGITSDDYLLCVRRAGWLIGMYIDLQWIWEITIGQLIELPDYSNRNMI